MTDVNPQIFKNLEKQLTEFLNTTKWTTKEYKQNEKINLRKRFHLDSLPSKAHLDATCDDKFTIILNGKKLGGSDLWSNEPGFVE